MYRLTNEGDTPASDVELAGHETLFRTPQIRDGGPDVGPNESLTFVAVAAWQTQDRTITVTWTNSDGEEQTWRYPLPPRPKRTS